MDKVLVEIFLPAANTQYDVFLPLTSRMSEVLMLVIKLINELSNGMFKSSNDSVLCDRKTGIIYNINMSVAELEIKNGSKLMLI